MSEEFKYRKSIKHDDKSLTNLKTWQLPTVDAQKKDPKNDKYTNAMGKPRGWVYEPPEPEPEAPKPPTIEEIEAIRQAAYDEGFNEGKAEGFAKGEAEGKKEGFQQGLEQGQAQGLEQGIASGTGIMEEKTELWNKLIAQLDAPLQQLNNEVEKQLVQLAAQLAKAVIKVELKTNPDVLLNSLKQAAELLPFNTKQCHILLNPEDLKIVTEHYSEEELNRRQWRLSAEPSITSGGIEIKTELSSVSYRMEERVAEIVDQFIQSAG